MDNTNNTKIIAIIIVIIMLISFGFANYKDLKIPTLSEIKSEMQGSIYEIEAESDLETPSKTEK